MEKENKTYTKSHSNYGDLRAKQRGDVENLKKLRILVKLQHNKIKSGKNIKVSVPFCASWFCEEAD